VGDGSSPLDWEEAPTEAAYLLILLVPDEDGRAAPMTSSGLAPAERRVLPAASPEFATFYHAEMPALISFLIKCGAYRHEAADDAQETFLGLFGKWESVRNPRKWLRAEAFRIFLLRPVGNTPRLEVTHDIPSPLSRPATFGFDAEETLLLDALELLPTVDRAVLALHYDQFRTRDIAQILGMTQATVRKNIKRGRAALEDILDLSGERPRLRREPPAGEAGG
jgi:RNA polymerase sigma factor (sigma-70 family)